MPPKRRTKRENKALPPRWEWHGGKIYYQIPPTLAGHPAFSGNRRRIVLGGSLHEAHQRWAEIQLQMDAPGASLLEELAKRFLADEVPRKKPKTQAGYIHSVGRILAAFQEFTDPRQIRPAHAYQYADKVKGGKHDVRALSAMLSYGVRIGIIDRNPLIGQLRLEKAPRRQYVTDEELDRLWQVLPQKWRLYVELKLMTGLRKGDLLTLQWRNITDDGIEVDTSKTGKALLYEWTPELRAVVDEIRQIPQRVRSMYLFATRDGQPYYVDGQSSGFNAMWQRYKKKAGVTFTEHDIRAKAASDNDERAAQKALGHTDPRMTARYRRRAERVTPLGISGGRKTRDQ